MKKIPLGSDGVSVPAVAVGCMRIAKLGRRDLTRHISFCVEHGLNFFDHADIYGGGECEELFGKAFEDTSFCREDIFIQSKCGIREGMYDFSKEHILKSVDGILSRLNTDYLDVLVLHRPDALVEPEEVAEAFDLLESSGKVLRFGVSNHRPLQIELLKRCISQPIAVNQLQFGAAFSTMISSGIEANMLTDGAVDRDGGVLDYCRLNDITIQAWSPFLHGFFKGVFLGDRENFPKLNETLEALAEKYGVTPTGIAAAWVLRHPAGIQLIAGTTKIFRLEEILAGSEINLSRKEWYDIYLSAGHILP